MRIHASALEHGVFPEDAAHFKSLKSIDLGIRPIHHRTEDRTRAHVFLCMLAGRLTWHLRQAWAPLILATRTRNRLCAAGTTATFDVTALPTPVQR